METVRHTGTVIHELHHVTTEVRLLIYTQSVGASILWDRKRIFSNWFVLWSQVDIISNLMDIVNTKNILNTYFIWSHVDFVKGIQTWLNDHQWANTEGTMLKFIFYHIIPEWGCSGCWSQVTTSSQGWQTTTHSYFTPKGTLEWPVNLTLDQFLCSVGESYSTHGGNPCKQGEKIQTSHRPRTILVRGVPSATLYWNSSCAILFCLQSVNIVHLPLGSSDMSGYSYWNPSTSGSQDILPSSWSTGVPWSWVARRSWSSHSPP